MRKNEVLLEIRDLEISFPIPRGIVRAVRGISYDVHRGEVMGVIGESGSGKSVEAYSIMRLLKSPGRVDGGHIIYEGRDVFSLSRREMEAFRGSEVGMIFQDPMSGLDPVFTIGHQLSEILLNREWMSKKESFAESVAVLESVGIRDARGIMKRYQSSLSGGMRQRVMIAMALISQPQLLIADEPTTMLDVTIQDQIIRLLKEMQEKTGMAMIFITHNFGLLADICDSVTVMYGGKIMETGLVDDVFYSPAHPYTRGLLKAIPRVDFRNYERLVPIEGEPVDPINPPSGCPFHPRCSLCMDICTKAEPPATELSKEHSAACWLLSGRAHG